MSTRQLGNERLLSLRQWKATKHAVSNVDFEQSVNRLLSCLINELEEWASSGAILFCTAGPESISEMEGVIPHALTVEIAQA